MARKVWDGLFTSYIVEVELAFYELEAGKPTQVSTAVLFSRMCLYNTSDTYTLQNVIAMLSDIIEKFPYDILKSTVKPVFYGRNRLFGMCNLLNSSLQTITLNNCVKWHL